MASDCDTLTENLDAAPAEDLLGAIGVALVRHQYGYSDEQMETAAAQSCADAGCEPFDASYFGAEFAGSTAYDCTNENGDSHHPIRDAIAEASDLANVAVEAVEALGWRPPAREIGDPDKLDALPVGTVGIGPSGVVWTRWRDRWTANGSTCTSAFLAKHRGPLTIVHVPVDEATADA